MELFDTNVASQDNMITELRLYNEIVAQINNSYMQFKEAGITQQQMEQALNDVESRMGSMNLSTNAQAASLSQNITNAITLARNNVKAVFSSNAGGGDGN